MLKIMIILQYNQTFNVNISPIMTCFILCINTICLIHDPMWSVALNPGWHIFSSMEVRILRLVFEESEPEGVDWYQGLGYGITYWGV
jgi:hypothetical protein